MKRLIVVAILALASWAYADFPGSPIGGGGGSSGGTTNASDLTSGTLPAARIGDGSVVGSKIAAGTAIDNTTTLAYMDPDHLGGGE